MGFTISWTHWASEKQGKVMRRDCWDGIRLQGLFELFLRHPLLWGTAAGWGYHDGRTGGRPQGNRDGDTLKWVLTVAACPTKTPPCVHTSQMGISENHHWERCSSQTWACNMRVVVAGCHIIDGASPFVQTGSEHDLAKPLGRMCLRTVTIELVFYVLCQTILWPQKHIPAYSWTSQIRPDQMMVKFIPTSIWLYCGGFLLQIQFNKQIKLDAGAECSSLCCYHVHWLV